MNYILEIKAFYDWLKVNKLSTGSIALWHALMHIANKTGWQESFTVAIVVLEIKTGLKKQAIINARNSLKQAGLIEFSSRGGNQSAVYKINSLVSFKQTQTHTQGDTQTHTQGDTQTHTINKQNNTIQNETNIIYGHDDDMRVCVENNNNILNIYIPEDIKSQVFSFSRYLFLRYFGRNPSAPDIEYVFRRIKGITGGIDENYKNMLEYAFEQAQKANCLNINYINGIFSNFAKRGIETIEDCYRFEYEQDRANGLM